MQAYKEKRNEYYKGRIDAVNLILQFVGICEIDDKNFLDAIKKLEQNAHESIKELAEL